MNSREIALNILVKLDRDRAYVNKLLAAEFRNADLKPVDKAFINELVLGCVKNRYLLDYIIMQFSKVKIKKMSVWVRNILELGVYQIIFLDKVPSSAACNESVKLGRRYANRSCGFINGVLRNISRGAESVRFPDSSGDILEYLSINYSFPKWMVKKLVDDYGYEFCEDILKSANAVSSAFIRANALKAPENESEFVDILRADGIDASPIEELKGCYAVKGALDLHNSDTYKRGLFSVQNRSSQLASIILEPKPGQLVIDVCAAPGGKTTHIAELMGNKGKVIAFDFHEHKISQINEAAQRLGITIIEACRFDSTMCKPELIGKADRVLVDAPCSGLGVMNSKPDIRWHREEGDIAELNEIQSKILSSSAKYEKSGGFLVYSTCTILKDENERRVSRFLSEHSDFELVDERKLFTHIDGGSGFYIAKLKRT